VSDLRARARTLLGFIVVLGGFFLLAALLFIPVPVENKDLLNIGMGVALGWVGTVVGYEFGSSRKPAPTDEPQPVQVTNGAADPVPVEAK
jgi:hypothetical protein